MVFGRGKGELLLDAASSWLRAKCCHERSSSAAFLDRRQSLGNKVRATKHRKVRESLQPVRSLLGLLGSWMKGRLNSVWSSSGQECMEEARSVRRFGSAKVVRFRCHLTCPHDIRLKASFKACSHGIKALLKGALSWVSWGWLEVILRFASVRLHLSRII